PPSRRNGNNGSARENGSSTSTAERPSTVPVPVTARPCVLLRTSTGVIRSAGSGAADEKSVRLRVTSLECEQIETPSENEHGLAPTRYVVGPFAMKVMLVGCHAGDG